MGPVQKSQTTSTSRATRPSRARSRRLRKIRSVFCQVLVLCGIKVAVHALGLERISVNQLFLAMVASTVFLLGFP